MSFEIVHPGSMSLLQDYGRFGLQHLGLTRGGPADEHALLWSNRLLNNPPRATAIEVTMGKLGLRSRLTTRIALAGADTGATIGGRPAANWQTHLIAAGEELRLGIPREGLRSYIAVPGGFSVKPHFGSTSTVVREGVGGLDQQGQALAAGDVLPFSADTEGLSRVVPEAFVADYSAPLTLRLVAGYQYQHFLAADLERFFAGEYTVSANADRMGYRLDGPAIGYNGAAVISEGIAPGAVQVTGDGQPIVLLSDRQTIGGYPKVGCIASLDAAKLAQRRPGQKVRFRRGDVRAIVEERLEFDRYFGLGNRPDSGQNPESD